MTRSAGRRTLAFGVLPLVFLAAAALPGPLLGDRLPDPLASHWTLDGTVDGTVSRDALWIGACGAWLLAWAVVLLRLRGRATRLPEAVPVLAGGGFVAGLASALALANLDAPSAGDAGMPSPALVFAPVALGAAAGLAAWWAERGRAWSTQAPPVPGPGLPQAATTPVVWVGAASGRELHVAGAGIAAVVAGIAVATGIWGLLLVAAIAGLASFALGSVQVVAGPRGLVVRVSPFGLPVKTIRAADIASAEAAHIRPERWGGYGWRFSGTGASAVVLRRGPGLVVHGRDGRRFAVTVDDPEAGAAVLNTAARGAFIPA